MQHAPAPKHAKGQDRRSGDESGDQTLGGTSVNHH
jgi:hypothetical protein